MIMRYLRGGGSKDFALVTSAEEFDRLVEVCPVGTDIIVFRDKQVPIRGIVDHALVQRVQELLPNESGEYLFLMRTPTNQDDPRCFGEFDEMLNLRSDLEDLWGESIAIGICPDFIAPDNERMISASKGGIDGPR